MIVTFSVSSCIWAVVVGVCLLYAIYLDRKEEKGKK